MHNHARTHNRLARPIRVGHTITTAFVFCLMPMALCGAVQVEWLSQQPVSPVPGDQVAIAYRVRNDSTTNSISFDMGLLWKKPNGATLNNFVHEVSLGPGDSVDFSDSATCPVEGGYPIVAYDMQDGPSEALSTTTVNVAAGGPMFDVTWVILPHTKNALQPVTIDLGLQNHSTTQRVRFKLVLACEKQDGTVVFSNQHTVNVAPGMSPSLGRDTVMFPEGGTYTVKAYDFDDGPTLPLRTVDIDVGPPLSMSDPAAIVAALRVAFTHTPANPVSLVMHQGIADTRDKVDLKCTVTNGDPSRTTPASSLQLVLKDMQGTTVYSQSISLPSLNAGASKEFTYQFKINSPPGRHILECFLSANGGRTKIGSDYIIETVAANKPELLNPSIGTLNATPLTIQHDYTVTYKSPDDTGPDHVKVAISAVPGTLFEMQRIDNGSFALGTTYRYTHPGALPIGNYSFQCFAYMGGQEVAHTGTCIGPHVGDDTPPVITISGARPGVDIIVTDISSVTLSGSAVDSESGVTKVEWRVAGGQWRQAQGTDSWTFTYDSNTADQASASKTLELRAENGAGTMTLATAYYKQKVVWERRHPKIADTYVTSCGMGPVDLVNAAKPPNKGKPQMGTPYYVAVKVVNPNPTMSYDIVFRLQENAVGYSPPNPSWDLNITHAPVHAGEPVRFTIGPNETKWVWTGWIHDWNWISEPNPAEFFTAVFMFCPVLDFISDAYTCANWLNTIKHAVPSTKYSLGPHPDMSQTLLSSMQPVSAEVFVSDDKIDYMFVSFTCSMTGMIGTAVAAASSWTGVGGIAGTLFEVACIAAGHATYYCAWDPQDDFKRPVNVEFIDLPELEDLGDAREREAAEAAARMAAYLRATHAAFARHLGAATAGDKSSAADRGKEAAEFLRSASKEARTVATWTQTWATQLAGMKKDERAAIKNQFKGGLPEAEAELMLRRFGFSEKEVKLWGTSHQKAMTEVLDDPARVATAAKKLPAALARLAKECDDRVRALGE